MSEKSIEKVLIFDVWADYAHFRKIYTTTSPLTFSVPPRTAISGIIGAIIGLTKKDNGYLEYFTLGKAKIGLRIVNPIKKIRIAENLIHTKLARGIGMNLITERAQISFEFLKNPKYRIYFWHNDNVIYNAFKKQLSAHKSVYTPCLGLSENIANFGFIGEFGILPQKSNGDIMLHSIISINKLKDERGVNFTENMEYSSERIPVEMNQERIVTKYSDIIFERNGRPIKAKISEHYWQIKYADRRIENVVFIE